MLEWFMCSFTVHYTSGTLSQGCRKVILSTNIAETSITIPGVCYVVDTGMVKARGYNPHIGLDLLCVQPVSKAQVCEGQKGKEGIVLLYERVFSLS